MTHRLGTILIQYTISVKTKEVVSLENGKAVLYHGYTSILSAEGSTQCIPPTLQYMN